jgi:pimeloyl-ACP methyl ester carboxylesterase
LLVTGLLCFLAFLHVYKRAWLSIVPNSQSCNSHARTFTYPGEKVIWHACGERSNRTLECGNVTVPMDQFNATNSGNKTFTIPLIRLRGHNATQSILFNPGGPGGSGVGAIYSIGEKLHAMIGEGFHLLSFDPRGINGSIPAASCYPESNQEQKVRHMQPLIHQGARVADMGELVAWTSNYVKACSETMDEHGSYINTPQTAADMNSILDAVGQQDMLYYGVSYGTVLGQTYAAMFPERSRRVIIDGVVNAFQWYSELTFSESLDDNEVIFDNFLAKCVEAGPENCTLASAAADAHLIKARILDTVEDLRAEPLSVYLNSTHYGLITAEMVLNTAAFNALYRPSLWPDLADNLSQLMAGNGTAFFLKYGLADAPDMTAFNFVVGNDGLSGPEYWKQGSEEMQEMLRPLWNATLMGSAQNILYFAKQQWPLARTHSFELKRPGMAGQTTIKTAHPVLILSTTYDPVTPLKSARAANSAFEGSQIVEVKGFGHASIAEPSRCLVRKFREYFYEGKLPHEHTTCEVDLPYFPRDDDRDKIKVVTAEIEDEEKAYVAQVALAKEWMGPHY